MSYMYARVLHNSQVFRRTVKTRKKSIDYNTLSNIKSIVLQNFNILSVKEKCAIIMSYNDLEVIWCTKLAGLPAAEVSDLSNFGFNFFRWNVSQ